jgi:hypothetical protein
VPSSIKQQKTTHPEQVIIIEFKCRETHYYEQGTRNMNAPYDDKSNCPRNQDQLQLGWTTWLFRHTFPDIEIVGAFVLRIHSSGIHHYPLESWVLEKDRVIRALKILSLVAIPSKKRG